MEQDELEEIVQWRDEAWQLADKYGQHVTLSMLTVILDEHFQAFKKNPSPENWMPLSKAMYQYQHIKNNYGAGKQNWEQMHIQYTKDVTDKLDKDAS